MPFKIRTFNYPITVIGLTIGVVNKGRPVTLKYFKMGTPI